MKLPLPPAKNAPVAAALYDAALEGENAPLAVQEAQAPTAKKQLVVLSREKEQAPIEKKQLIVLTSENEPAPEIKNEQIAAALQTEQAAGDIIAEPMALFMAAASLAAPNEEPEPEPERYENEYSVGDVTGVTKPTISAITIEEMLTVLGDKPNSDPQKYETFYNLAKSMNLGQSEEEVVKVLTHMVNDYAQAHAAYEQYLKDYDEYLEKSKTDPTAVPPAVVPNPTVPRIETNGVDIRVQRVISDTGLTDNGDGTYALGGDIQAYKTEVIIDADAALTLYYDGKTEVSVHTGTPTDFVIALDVSASMRGDRYEAMKKALGVLLEEIFAEKENTVSIVCWGEYASVIEINGLEWFGADDGVTVDEILAKLKPADQNYTLPNKGLEMAYALLDKLAQPNVYVDPNKLRNAGILLFTDGAANGSNSGRDSRENTIIDEKQLFKDFGATVVNVAIGNESALKQYENYLNPKSDSYDYDALGAAYTTDRNAEKNREALQEKVIYYSIPALNNEQLTDKITELFVTAFEDIVSEKWEIETKTITKGVLAAVSAKLLDTIPAGFELVEVEGETPSYKVQGIDEQGNTTIEISLENIVSGTNESLAYYVVPKDEKQDIGIVAWQGQETVLVTEPIDKVIEAGTTKKAKTISVVYTYDYAPPKLDMPHVQITYDVVDSDESKNPTGDVIDAEGVRYISIAWDKVTGAQDYSISVYELRNGKYRIIDSKTVSASGSRATSYDFTLPCSEQFHFLVTANAKNHESSEAGSATSLNWEQHYNNKLLSLTAGDSPMANDVIVVIMKARLKIEGSLAKDSIRAVVGAARDADASYRDLYAYSFFNYKLDPTAKRGACLYTQTGNDINFAPSILPGARADWFRESGRAIEGSPRVRHTDLFTLSALEAHQNQIAAQGAGAWATFFAAKIIGDATDANQELENYAAELLAQYKTKVKNQAAN